MAQGVEPPKWPRVAAGAQAWIQSPASRLALSAAIFLCGFGFVVMLTEKMLVSETGKEWKAKDKASKHGEHVKSLQLHSHSHTSLPSAAVGSHHGHGDDRSVDQVPDGVMPLILVHEAVDAGAVCLDGTPPGFYFRKGIGSGSDKWFIHFQGGAWCATEWECWFRSSTDLGTSHKFPPTKASHGAFSNNPDINPDMYNWNTAFINYCDGGSFAGHRDEPFEHEGKKIYIRGRKIRDFIIQLLLDKYGMAEASKVVISGCSAGGLAAILTCDHIATTMLTSVADVRCMPDAAVFLDILDLRGVTESRNIFQSVFDMHRMADGVNIECIAAKAPEEQYQCIMAQYALPFIKTPTFVVNSLYDSWSLLTILAEESADPTDSVLRACLFDIRSCNSSQIDVIQGFRNAMVAGLQPFQEAGRPHGTFAFSCFAHCATYHDDLWSQLTVGGQALAAAFGTWLRSDVSAMASMPHLVDCAYPCNKCALDRPEFVNPTMFF